MTTRRSKIIMLNPQQGYTSASTASTLRQLPDWSTLEFKFTQTDNMYLATCNSEGEWEGGVCQFRDMQISPAAAVLNYGQAAFEGLRAVFSTKGNIVLFRIEDNARRFRNSVARLVMPPYPVFGFVSAVEQLVRVEARWVPPIANGSLYIRPVMIGSGEVLGVRPAPSYSFYIFVSPVGQYRPGPGKIMIIDSTHRAACFGTGDIKAAGNYAGTLRAYEIAREANYKDVLYLDSRHDKYVEEIGSSNVFAVLRDGTLVTPRLGSILPGITRDSVIRIARELLGWRVVERDIEISEFLDRTSEAFFTGTAAAIQPITAVGYQGEEHVIGNGKSGERTNLLLDRLIGIQREEQPDPFDWVRTVKL